MTGPALEACELNRLIPTSDDLPPEFREGEQAPYFLNRVPILLCTCGTYFNPANYTHTQCRECQDRYEANRERARQWRVRAQAAAMGAGERG